MALLYVTEYARQAIDGNGHPLAAGEEPAIAIQVKTFTATAAAVDNAFNEATTFVRVFCDGDACILFTVAGTAATNQQDTPVNAEVPEFFGVRAGSGLKVSAVTRT